MSPDLVLAYGYTFRMTNLLRSGKILLNVPDIYLLIYINNNPKYPIKIYIKF
jgi:hypothetical protein